MQGETEVAQWYGMWSHQLGLYTLDLRVECDSPATAATISNHLQHFLDTIRQIPDEQSLNSSEVAEFLAYSQD